MNYIKVFYFMSISGSVGEGGNFKECMGRGLISGSVGEGGNFREFREGVISGSVGESEKEIQTTKTLRNKK